MRKVVFVAVVTLAAVRIEEIVSSGQFKAETGSAPDVCGRIERSC